MNFTAIDFETANGKRASVCAVGMTKVRNGEIVDNTSWLIKPPPGFTDFAPRNIEVHGITSSDVANAPSWVESARRILDYVGDDIVVAHYAAFDKSVWRQASEWSGVDFGDFQWMCSRDLAKAHLGLDDCSLPSVADSLGITGLDHHNAASDASVCAQIVLAIATRSGVSSWVDLNTITPQKSALSRSGRAYSSETSLKKSDLPEPNLDADPSHELYGQGITITGGFELLGRREAFQLAASFGAISQLGTTRKTTILVICDENPHAPGFDLKKGTTKSRKAHEYMTERGQQIRIMSETEFYVAVGMAPASMLEANRVEARLAPHSSSTVTQSTSDAVRAPIDELHSPNISPADPTTDLSNTHALPPAHRKAGKTPAQPQNDVSRYATSQHSVGSSSNSHSASSSRQKLGRIVFFTVAWILALATVFSVLCTAAGYSIDTVAGTAFLVITGLLGTGCYFAFRAARKR